MTALSPKDRRILIIGLALVVVPAAIVAGAPTERFRTTPPAAVAPMRKDPIDQRRDDTSVFVDFGTRRDLVTMPHDGSRMARHDLVAGRTLWDVPAPEGSGGSTPLAEARPLDADEEADIIWGNARGLVAVSGRTGRPLWQAHPEGVAEPSGPACWIGDIDRDGAEDLAWSVGHLQAGRVETWSGRDGHRLWRADLPTRPGSLPPVAVDLLGRPLVVATTATHLVALEPATGRTAFGPVLLAFAPELPPQHLEGFLFVCGQSDSLFLDASNGEPIGPGWRWRRSGLLAHHPPRWLAGDRLLRIGPLYEGPDAPIMKVGSTVGVGSIRTGDTLWSVSLPGVEWRPADCATLDVNRDGCRDLVAVHQLSPAGEAFARSWASSEKWRYRTPRPVPDLIPTIEARDGTTGALLWSRPMVTGPIDGARSVEPLLVGPDLDGDDIAEIFVASFARWRVPDPFDPMPWRHSLFVDAISGASGRGIWWWSREWMPIGDSREMSWRSRGPDRLPELLVGCDPPESEPTRRWPSRAWILRATDGALLREISGDHDVSARDLDKDGRDELIFAPSGRPLTGPVPIDRNDSTAEGSLLRADPGRDPRRFRLLPWADGPLILFVVGSVPAALVLLVLPAYATVRAIRTRSLRWMLASLAAVALWVALARQGPLARRNFADVATGPRAQATQWLDLTLRPIARVVGGIFGPTALRALVGLPLAAVLPACWAWRHRCRRLLIAWATSSGAIAFAWWLADRPGIGPDNAYYLEGWPWLGLWGACVLGTAGVIRWIAVGAWQPEADKGI